ncbi:PhzF family phenazine biosynthesis isomerase [Woodsholea maritima]|uniref:PhzF family phenazine biosynthesis isomerase n=1 Tax=Woodsholea maritima TaxID=240237 RepID=UPI00037EDF81|nr:PhzF family phenazine biosynthesis isomerase [Woodsholea maritima]
MDALSHLIDERIEALEAPYQGDVHTLDHWQRARQASALSGRPTLVICGANWCPDARMLASMVADPRLSDALAARFEVALVDVGDYERAQGVHAHYGHEVLEGLPAVFVVSPDGAVINTDTIYSWRNARTRHLGELVEWLFPLAEPSAAQVFEYFEVHAFCDGDRPFTGNPAGVCLLERDLPDGLLLGIAKNNNLSETAYLKAIEGRDDTWALRWFTPGCEVDLCGHATLGAAATLFHTRQVRGDVAHFETRSGLLKVRQTAPGHYQMDFPVVGFAPAPARKGVVAAMGAGEPHAVFEIEPIHGAPYQMLVYGNESVIANLAIDHSALAKTGVNVVATAKGDKVDFVSRFFAPAVGLVEEDPVTGSAHCTLAPYWAEQLGKTDMSARQIGPRPGAVDVSTEAKGRVHLSGAAKVYLQGLIRI